MFREIRHVMNTDPDFPEPLRDIPDAPSEIFMNGTAPPKHGLAIAIVGTRRATPGAIALTQRFAGELASHGFSVISGLAFGIDAAAHIGCLEAGGRTIAVIPCGLDRIYPRSHQGLAQRIFDHGGAIVSEYPAGTEALPYRFLERNRIVSGLARGVLIIEAPERSGALATARFAAEQGRDCFVIPGSINHPNYVGSHELIRKGAELVTKPDDILEAYGVLSSASQPAVRAPQRDDLSADEKIIFDVITRAAEPLEVDKIIRGANLQPQAVNVAITMLLVKKVIQETAQGYMLS